jgi:hypothetical protein
MVMKSTRQTIANILLVFSSIIATSLSFNPKTPLVQYGSHSTKVVGNFLSKTSFSPCASRNTKNRERALVMTYGAPSTATIKTSIAAITGIISGGIFAGGLHAIAGKKAIISLFKRVFPKLLG